MYILEPFKNRIDELEKEVHDEWMLRTFAEAKYQTAKQLLKQCLYAGLQDKFLAQKITQFLTQEIK